MKKNVLFSTTRQWNPGDEFILMGIINLLKEVVGEFNAIIYNRNPEVRQEFDYLNPFRKSRFCNFNFKGKGILESFFRIGFWDNSFKDDMNLDFIDFVIFAGSPEWMGRRLLPLYKKLLNYNKPILYLGIGSGKEFKFENIKAPYIDILKKAKLITVRDNLTYKALRPLNPHYLPCPALFSSSYEKEIKEVKKIGLIFATDKAVVNNRVSKQTYHYLLKLYEELTKKFECEIVCHYIDELPEAFKLYKGLKIHYSYDAKDYLEIYKRFDLVIGPRVHGIGIAASMGIPGILIAHDLRGETSKGFLGKIVSEKMNIINIIQIANQLIDNIETVNISLIQHKNLYKEKYKRYLFNALS